MVIMGRERPARWRAVGYIKSPPFGSPAASV
jgi:hypothetical protein